MKPVVNRFGMIECPLHAAINKKIVDPYDFMNRILDEAEGKVKVKRKWKPAAKSITRVKEGLIHCNFDQSKTAKFLDIRLGSLRNYIYYMRKMGIIPKPEVSRKNVEPDQEVG
jgi:hypothetical protein